MYRRLPVIYRTATAMVFALICLAAVPATPRQSAQQTEQPSEQQGKRSDNPFAGPEDQKVLIFAGAWQEDVRYAGDPADSPSGKGRWIARPAFGIYLFINYEGTGPEGDTHAHGVLAYDHEDRVYKLWWFDDAGNIGEYSGTWKDDNTLVLEHKKTSGGQPFRERITYTRISQDEVRTRIEQAWGTETYKEHLAALAHRAKLVDGQRWGEKLSPQGKRGRPGTQQDSPPPKKQEPPPKPQL
jgi:hypothetical protein